jgi:hypothetical protein
MLFQYLLKSADHSGLANFVSPEFFRVVSVPALLRGGKALLRNRADTERWHSIRAELDARPEAAAMTATTATREVGERALVLFFDQILTRTCWVLDFRSSAFPTADDAGATWRPEPYFYDVSADFGRAVRSLYRGFYGEDEAAFDQALAALNLTPARDALREHFGSGDQTSVRFDLRTFQATFTEVFRACAREKLELHPDFFALGLSLLCLYENLESRGRAYDVRAAFLEADARSEHR